jgi:hypothetical protein
MKIRKYNFSFSFMLPVLQYIFDFLLILTLFEICRCIIKKIQRVLHKEVIKSGPFSEYKCIEIYVILLIILELYALFFHSTLNSLFINVILCILCYRLFEIFVLWFRNYIVGSPEPISARRFLILTLINYFEVGIIFAFISLVFGFGFQKPISSAFQSLNYSICVATGLGSSFEPRSTCAYLIFFSEITLAILFLIVIIQITLSLFKK